MKPVICVVLGGGAARGLAHLGVLKVLEAEGIPIEMIVGTSLGALVGGLYAADPNSARLIGRVDEFLHSFRARATYLEFIRKVEQKEDVKRRFFSDTANLLRKGYFWGMTASKPAFISAKEYRRFIYPLLPDIRIEALKMPFACVATEIMHGGRKIYTSGPLRIAVSASCALPGIFPPVHDGDELLVDGGWVERVPVNAAFDLGAKVVIAVDVAADMPRFTGKSGLDIIMRANAVTRVHVNSLMVSRADVMIHPDVGDRHWADFSNPVEMYRKGEAAARARLPEIRAALELAGERGN